MDLAVVGDVVDEPWRPDQQHRRNGADHRLPHPLATAALPLEGCLAAGAGGEQEAQLAEDDVRHQRVQLRACGSSDSGLVSGGHRE